MTSSLVVDAMVAADAFSRAYQLQSGRHPAAVGHEPGLAFPASLRVARHGDSLPHYRPCTAP